nr:MAG TPA: portal protein [Caudoviricetes sp.]
MARKNKKFSAKISTPRAKNSGYSEGGASRDNKSLKGYNPRKLGYKADIGANLSTLRDRSADLAINTPVGTAAINTSTTHTVGAGLNVFPKPKFQILGISAEEARTWARKVRTEFDLWAESKDCDIYRKNNLYDMQSIAYQGYLTDGDSFAVFRRKPTTPDMPYTLRLQLIEGNRISNPLTNSTYVTGDPTGVEALNPDNGNRILNGVEIDTDGAIVAYWVSNQVPGEPITSMLTIWARVEAYGKRTSIPNVLQISNDTRPEQYRGVPYLAPVIETLKQVYRYTNAELTSAIIKSYFALFFTEAVTNSGSLNDMLADNGVDDPTEPVVDVSEYNLGPGTLNALPKGVDVKSVDASNAQSTFEVFSTQLIKQVGAALNQPYEVLMKNFNSSYSASRAAMLQAWEEYKLRRKWFARDFCQPIYEVWLMEAVANGRIEAPGFFDDPLIRKAWCNADWFGPTMSILDPVKDMNGSTLRVQNGVSTREREAAEMTGTDLEENIAQLAFEKQLMEKYGMGLADAVNPSVGSKSEAKGGEEDE